MFATYYEGKWTTPEYSSPEVAERLLLVPLKQSLSGPYDPRVADLACGTGRLSLLLLGEAWFQGHIDAVDVSPEMLRRFTTMLARHHQERQDRVTIQNLELRKWRCPQNRRYAAIAMLECSEFVAGFPQVVDEVFASLQPGGLFLLTRPASCLACLFFGRKQTKRQMTRLLTEKGFRQVQFFSWTRRHDVVHAWKSSAPPPGAQDEAKQRQESVRMALHQRRFLESMRTPAGHAP
jgi:SAM-dependent methyltransferase